MSVYVGKDVEITVQAPVEEDVSSQADGVNTVFSVSHTPISDRDLDGIADEPEHATVHVDGSAVSVSAVDDDQGQVTLASAPSQGSKVIIEYRYDLNPHIAQELTISPKQTIEGIDGLGSDLIQEWAVLEKAVEGSIKEVFKAGSLAQLDRFLRMKRESLYSQQFWGSEALNDFEGYPEYYLVDNQELLVNSNNSAEIWTKTSACPVFKNGIIKCKYKKASSGDSGWLLRCDGSIYNQYRVYFDGSKALRIARRKGGETEYLLTTSPLSLPADFFPVEIQIKDNKIVVIVNEEEYFQVVDDNPLSINGRPGFLAYYGLNDRFDEFQVWIETSPHEYGMIVKWDQTGSAVKIGLDRVLFPEGSIPSPKNQPVFIVTPFRAVTAKTIT